MKREAEEGGSRNQKRSFNLRSNLWNGAKRTKISKPGAIARKRGRVSKRKSGSMYRVGETQTSARRQRKGKVIHREESFGEKKDAPKELAEMRQKTLDIIRADHRPAMDSWLKTFCGKG